MPDVCWLFRVSCLSRQRRNFQQVIDMKASDHIYRVVESQISQRELLPGDPVDEEILMAQFGVSRTPVREAILRLKAEGLVSSISRGGAIVSKMDFAQLLAVWELLAELEGLSARYACERMTKQQRQALADAHHAAQDVVVRNDAVGWQQANMAFHEVLYEGSRNPYLRQEILRMRVRTSAYRSHSFDAMGFITQANDYHGRIVQAILDNDAQTAAKLATAHLTPGEGAPAVMDIMHQLPKGLLA
ncbi:GntR family transcriptional regulator [Tardiphaga sp.]|jgi:DNA-binding GntR family transcriptional regulator|uniref:GntR family transcriptional regulator n=1 Tax=Tardiphaga sp. TaxID=1926292 RepID=UPI0037D9F951